MRKIEGFTLVEMLISAALLGVLLTAMAGILTTTSKAYNKQTEISEQQQETASSIGVFSYELGLAGYRGTDGLYATRTFPGDTFSVSSNGVITVRYYEDRFTTNKELKEVSFYVANEELIRADLTNDTTAVLIEGITNIRTSSYINLEGLPIPTENYVPEDSKGVVVELKYSNNDKQELSVLFSNNQSSTASSTTQGSSQ